MYFVVIEKKSHFNFHKLKSKSDSLLEICPLLKKIVHVLMFYVLSHLVSGLQHFRIAF